MAWQKNKTLQKALDFITLEADNPLNLVLIGFTV